MIGIKKLLELPIIQAPMAGVQGSALAIAVCKAGGLGSLPCAMLTPDQARQEIKTIIAATSRPFGLNFFCHVPPHPNPEKEAVWRRALAPYYAEYGINPDSNSLAPARTPFDSPAANLVEEFKPAVVSFHFGLPAPELVQRVKSAGAMILSTATTVDEALWLQAHGADAVIAQGSEAGGHRGMFLTQDPSTQIGILALVHQIVRAVRVPVIAAGGIADSRGLAAVLQLGAVAAQVGTAYLLCAEAKTSLVHRAALKSEASRLTAITNLFSGRPARGIMNRLMTELGPMNSVVPDFPLASNALSSLRSKAEALGKGDFSPLWAGQNAAGCKEVSATVLTEELAADVRLKL